MLADYLTHHYKTTAVRGGQFMQYTHNIGPLFEHIFYHFWARDFRLLDLIVACCCIKYAKFMSTLETDLNTKQESLLPR